VQGDSPNFDWTVVCPGDSTVVTPLIDKPDGEVQLQVFVGDEPSGAYPYACGPSQVPTNQAFDTCYIRIVQTSLDDNEHDMFIPITFKGATPSSTTAAATAASGSTTSEPPRVTVAVVKKRSRRTVVLLAWGIGAVAAGALVGGGVSTLVRARRKRLVSTRS
jgi:hypothetical protein